MIKKWSLSKVSIQNFKSILALSFEVQQGFTILTGANGSGKSNILEAISKYVGSIVCVQSFTLTNDARLDLLYEAFGLGEAPQNLRVSSMEELHHGSGKTIVELTFKSQKDGIAAVIGSSIIDKQRNYFVASKKVTKRIFEHYVRTNLGFSNERSCYNIKQHAAQKLIKASSKQLFSFLCDAAGTQTLLCARDDARFQIGQARISLNHVRASICQFETEVEKDSKLRQILIEMKEIKRKFQQVCIDIKNSSYLGTLSDLYCVLHSIQTDCEELKDAEKRKLEKLEQLHDAEVQLHQSIEFGDKIDSDIRSYEELTNVLELELNTQLEDLVNLLVNATEKKEHHGNLQEDLIKRKYDAKVQLEYVQHQIRSIEGKIPPTNKDISHWEAQLNSELDPIFSTELKPLDCRDKYLQQKRKIQSSLQQRNTDFMRLTSSCLELVALEVSQGEVVHHLKSCVVKSKERIRELIEDLMSLNDNWNPFDTGNQDHMMACENDLNDARAKVFDKQSRLAAAVHERSVFRKRKLNLPLDVDIGGFGSHDYGCLADVLVVSIPPELNCHSIDHSKNEVMRGLQHVIGANLGVRLCSSQEQAIDIMKQYEDLQGGTNSGEIRGSLRIWPLDVIQTVRHRHRSFTDLITSCSVKSGGWQAVDPVTCFDTSILTTVSPDLLQRALFKACQNWILTPDDNTAKDIMAKVVCLKRDKSGQGVNGIGCITLSGNRHTVGGLTITSCSNAESIIHEDCKKPVSYLNDYGELNQYVNSFHDELKCLEGDVKRKSQTYIISVQLNQERKQLMELQSQLSVVLSTHHSTQQELQRKDQERQLQEAELSSESERLNNITCVINDLEKCHGRSAAEESMTLVANYDATQLRQHQDILLGLETRLTELDSEQDTLTIFLEDSEIQLQQIVIDLQENELRIEGLRNRVTNLRHQVDSIEIRISKINIVDLKERVRMNRKLVQGLRNEVDDLRENASSEVELVSCLSTGCLARTCDFNDKVDILKDGEDSNLSRVQKAVMLQLSQYSSVDLLKESSIRCLCEIIKAEVTRSFEEGPALAKHLELDSATFLKSTSSELAVLISSKDKLRGRWRVLQHDSLSLQQQLTSEFTKKRNIAQDSDDFELESREILDLDEYEMLTGQRQVLLENLKSKFDQITAGIVVLEGGLDSLHDQLKEIHQNVNEKIRSRFSDYFDDLVNLKDVTCDLEAITSTEEIPLSPNAVGTSSPIDSLENGFRIVLKEIPSIEKQHRLSDRQCTYDCIGVQSLSGGQQALLGLALVFSCALSGQRSPVYFLDEVDSSLDEANQNAIAKAIGNIFMDTNMQQVICVSHNKNFQTHTTNRLSVQMKEGHTIIL